MSLKELLGDSAWLFELGFPIQRFDVTSSKTGLLDDLSWELSPDFAAPSLESISEQPKRCDFRFAWHERGLMADIQVTESKNTKAAGAQTTLVLNVDTRSSPGIHRASSYCHRFLFHSPKATSAKSVLSVFGESLKIARAKDSPPPVPREDLPAKIFWINDSTYGWRVFLRKPILHGYDPIEFPEIGLYAVVSDTSFGESRLSRSGFVPAHEDPSTWCRGKLV